MGSRPTINPGTLIWSGEHWVNYLGNPLIEKKFGLLSLYVTRYSPAGEGHVALVNIAADKSLQAMCTDNKEVAAFIFEYMIHGQVKYFDKDLPLLEACFRRGGDLRIEAWWTIETAADQIVATWQAIQPPLVVEGFVPFFSETHDLFTILFFADEARIDLNGSQVPARPYLRDIWRKSLGGDRSSCVFALAETMIKV